MRLATVCETKAWVWVVAGRPGHDELVVGCDAGSIRMRKLKFQHITAIYKVGDLACPLKLLAIYKTCTKHLAHHEGSVTSR